MGVESIYCSVRRKKVPSWEKICFQLGNYFFPTGNPYLGGYSDSVEFLPYFRRKLTYKIVENRVKGFYI